MLLYAASKRSTSTANLKQTEAVMNKRLSSSAALLNASDRSKCLCVCWQQVYCLIAIWGGGMTLFFLPCSVTHFIFWSQMHFMQFVNPAWLFRALTQLMWSLLEEKNNGKVYCFFNFYFCSCFTEVESWSMMIHKSFHIIFTGLHALNHILKFQQNKNRWTLGLDPLIVTDKTLLLVIHTHCYVIFLHLSR